MAGNWRKQLPNIRTEFPGGWERLKGHVLRGHAPQNHAPRATPLRALLLWLQEGSVARGPSSEPCNRRKWYTESVPACPALALSLIPAPPTPALRGQPLFPHPQAYSEMQIFSNFLPCGRAIGQWARSLTGQRGTRFQDRTFPHCKHMVIKLYCGWEDNVSPRRLSVFRGQWESEVEWKQRLRSQPQKVPVLIVESQAPPQLWHTIDVQKQSRPPEHGEVSPGDPAPFQRPSAHPGPIDWGLAMVGAGTGVGLSGWSHLRLIWVVDAGLSHFSRVLLFTIPWTVACQAPLSMGFPRQEYWSGLPFPSPGDLPNPEIEPMSPALQADSLPSKPPGKPTSTT